VRRQRISLWIIGACLVLATQSIALDWSAGVVVDRGVLGRSALLALEPWFPWILLAFPLAWIHRRFSLVRGFSWTFGLVHLAMAVVVSVAILEGWDRWSEPLLHGVHEQMAMDYLRPCLEDEDFFLPGELSCPTTEFGVEDLPPFPYSNLLRGVPFEVETVIVGGHVGYAGFYDRLPRFLTYVLTYAGLLAMSQALLVRFEMARAREDAALMRSRVDRMRLVHVKPLDPRPPNRFGELARQRAL